MKKLMKRFTCGLMVILMSLSFVGCSGNDDEGDNSSDTTPKSYTVQYTDDYGTHQLEVTEGMPYAMKTFPQKTGHEFLGLYDAEVGGTQYVSATGASLAPFTDNKNIVLFPRFKLKDYTVVLDYQGAPVTGSRQFEVAYDTEIPELPKNLTKEHMEFMGWYTEKECKGTQIADADGNLPIVNVLNEKTYDISNDKEYIYLYAGFKKETVTVTFNFGETGLPQETMEVEYGTPISQVVPKTRNNDNFAVATWSKYADGRQPFTGKVTTDDMVLNATSWAPCIEFDCNEGKEVPAIVAKAGTSICLPVPKKDLAQFTGWTTMSDARANLTKMPEESTKLKAQWRGVLKFDVNGGTEVTNISENAGATITLPTTTKTGYFFAGWYTQDKKAYTSTTMPVLGTKLKAGWYKSRTASSVILTEEESVQAVSNEATFDDDLTMDFSEFLQADFKGTVYITAKWQERHNNSSAVAVAFYSEKTTASTCFYWIRRDHSNSYYEEVECTFTANLKGNKIYVTLAARGQGWVNTTYPGYIKDFHYEITYPDTGYLYL